MEQNIIVTTCKLERIFPPGFFNSMEHLHIHLAYEAIAGGHIQYRWMYPFKKGLFVMHIYARRLLIFVHITLSLMFTQ
jgi:hypothetical protein